MQYLLSRFVGRSVLSSTGQPNTMERQIASRSQLGTSAWLLLIMRNLATKCIQSFMIVSDHATIKRTRLAMRMHTLSTQFIYNTFSSTSVSSNRALYGNSVAFSTGLYCAMHWCLSAAHRIVSNEAVDVLP